MPAKRARSSRSNRQICGASNRITGPYFTNNKSRRKIACKRPAGHWWYHKDPRFIWGQTTYQTPQGTFALPFSIFTMKFQSEFNPDK